MVLFTPCETVKSAQAKALFSARQQGGTAGLFGEGDITLVCLFHRQSKMKLNQQAQQIIGRLNQFAAFLALIIIRLGDAMNGTLSYDI